MVCLLDADSIVYILAYNHKDHTDEKTMTDACEDFVRTILTMAQADSYIGVFSPELNFRYRYYKYAPYKGERSEKPDWYKFWEPIIKDYFEQKWKFICSPDIEADDVMAALAEIYDKDCIICSPDKDMRQITGLHYDYRKTESAPILITPKEAHYNLYLQILTGDSTDNIKGVPGLGEVKAKKILDALDTPMLYKTAVMNEYCRYFGGYYGPIIFGETQIAVQLLSSKHPLYEEYKNQITLLPLKQQEIPARKYISGFESIQQ